MMIKIMITRKRMDNDKMTANCFVSDIGRAERASKTNQRNVFYENMCSMKNVFYENT